MRHNIRLRGHAFEIRPVEMADAEFILSLRTDPELSRYIHPISPRLEDQQAWIARYFERPGDYYFIVERASNGRGEGAAGLYDVDLQRRQAEWGRWVMRKDSLAAVESALLVYRAAFEGLGLDRVYCRTVAANRSVVAFHSSAGLETSPAVGLTVNFGTTEYDVVEQVLTRDRWRTAEQLLDGRARAVTGILAR